LRLRFRRFNFGIYPRTFIRIAGLISVDCDDRRFEDKFKSSKCFNSFKSSGKVTKLLP
jgi:hypothetical protein